MENVKPAFILPKDKRGSITRSLYVCDSASVELFINLSSADWTAVHFFVFFTVTRALSVSSPLPKCLFGGHAYHSPCLPIREGPHAGAGGR